MLSILGMGHFHPENIIDNSFLESLDIGTNHEWIIDRVGIHTRRTILPLEYIYKTRNVNPCDAKAAAQYKASDLGVNAAKMAMEMAQVSPSDIGLLICGASIPEACVPSTACIIASKLGMQVPSFDITAACSTFLAHLHFLDNMKEERLPKNVLIVQPETYTTSINYNDRSAAVLFGDGASAAVISTDGRGRAKIIKTTFGSNPADCDKVQVPYCGHFIQDGKAVQRFAIKQTRDTFEELVASKGVNRDKIYFISHQANLSMLQSVCKRIGINEDRHYYNVDAYGNCGSAGGPSVLSQNWQSFQPGDELAMVVIGAGLSWGGALIQFGDK